MNILQCLEDKYDLTFEEFSEVPGDADDSASDYDYLLSSDDDELDCPKYCWVCCEAICGEAYKIAGEIFGLRLHKSCAELPGEIYQHPLHSHHPLKISADLDRLSDWICDGCGQLSLTLKYQCEKCDFKLDFLCVFNHESRALKERVPKLTVYHSHELQLLYFPLFSSPLLQQLHRGISCCGCQKTIRDSAYACVRCCFFIHESCLDTAPEKVKNLSVHRHYPLRFAKIDRYPPRTCQMCEIKINHIGFKCRKCEYYFHVSCAKRTAICYSFEDQVYGHYIDHSHRQTSKCTVCDKSCNGGFFRFLETGKNVHVECLLPRTKNHECHDHPLILTDAVVRKRNHNGYHCDICEKPGNITHHVYHCKECYYIAHLECVLSGEDSPLNDDSVQVRIYEEIEKIYRVEEITEAKDAKEPTEESDYERRDTLSIKSESDDSFRDLDADADTDAGTDSEEVRDSKQKRIKKLEQKIIFTKHKIARYTSRLTQLEEELAGIKTSSS